MGWLRTARANWPVGVMVFLVALWLRYAFGPTLAGHPAVVDRTVAVRLTPSAHPNLMVYEDERVRISIGYDDFRAYLVEQIRLERPAFQESTTQRLSEWEQQVIASFAAGQSYPLGTHYADELLIAEMLEQGQAAVTDKRRNRTIRTIYVQRTLHIAGWETDARRTFLLPLSPFLLDDPRFFESDSFYS